MKQKTKDLNTPDKYQIAKDFRDGVVQCLNGGTLDPNAKQSYLDGYEWAYRFVRPILNEELNQYIAKLGFKPFSTLEAMRKSTIKN